MPKFKRKMKKNQELRTIREIESGNPRRIEIGHICGYVKETLEPYKKYSCLINDKKIFLHHDRKDVFFTLEKNTGKIILLQDIDMALKILEEVINNEFAK